MALTIDIIVIALGIAALIWGAYKGLTAQIVGLIGIGIGLWLASKFTPNIAAWINEYFGGENSLDAIKIGVYILLVILIVILCKLLGKLLDNVFNLTILGGVNKILGSFFCLIKVMLILAAIASLINYAGKSIELDILKEFKQSKAFCYLLDLSDKILPFIKQIFLKE